MPDCDPVFWSKAGSAGEWTSPEYGPGADPSSGTSYQTGKFGNGSECSDKLVSNDGYVSVPHSTFSKDAGAMCFWVEPRYLHNPGQGYYYLVNPGLVRLYGKQDRFPNDPDPVGALMLMVWLRETGAHIPPTEPPDYGGVNFEYLGHVVSFTTDDAPWGELHHLAVVWDKDGIDGSSDTMRIYWDGTEVEDGQYQLDTESWHVGDHGDPYFDDVTFLSTGAHLDEEADGPSTHQIDDVLIFDYAHTDFSDHDTQGMGF